MMKRSLIVPGSLSSALHTTYFTGSGCFRTRSHFMLVGKPAPPIPRSSAALSCARTSPHAQLASAVEMATHVRADANFGFGRRREVKMRVETRDAVKLVERSVRALGKSFQLRRGQKAVAQLDCPKVVEDHVVRSRAQIAAQASWNARRGSGC